MNFKDILNAVLLELNYSVPNSFSEFTKPEHLRLKQVVNRMNKEVCSLSDNFYFRQRIKEIELDKETVIYPLNIDGKIVKVISPSCIYKFVPDYNLFFESNVPQNSYSFYGENLLISPSSDTVKFFYICSEFVKNKSGELKENFECETDESIIPVSFQERIFINGCAMNFKQNPSHPKYAHWSREYDKAIRTLAGNCKCDISQNTMIKGGFKNL